MKTCWREPEPCLTRRVTLMIMMMTVGMIRPCFLSESLKFYFRFIIIVVSLNLKKQTNEKSNPPFITRLSLWLY